ncbi:MAG: hypothetical protein DBY20_08335 [Coriobacteriia bacterium]|nr:MAG: hypothetical protein DBY20_08335 [Coriobacteriia bacterium]HJJ01252.1 hypothetical protein [Coriobacteriaceae bacterium]
MDKRENDEQNEVEVHLFAEEDFNDGRPAEETPQGEITVDFGEAAESMLDDIKSDSLYGISAAAAADADDFDPGDMSSDAVVNVDDVVAARSKGDRLTESADLDELSESINITEQETVEYVEDDDEFSAERAMRSRRRLRNLLVFFIIILLVLIAVIGLFIWRNSTPPGVKQPDSDVLQTSTAGTNAAQFQAIDAARIPDLITYFGMTPEAAVEASGNSIALDAEATAASDATLPNVVRTRNGWLVGPNGETLASITFGLNAAGDIDYIFASFDLDAFGVADAKFDELIASKVVASSILAGIGLDPAAVESAQLTIVENPQAVLSRDTSAQEVAEFTGPTNIEGVPGTWKVTETYDHTAGVTVGDNSVIRTLSVDLR